MKKRNLFYTIIRILFGLFWVFSGVMKFVPQETPTDLPKGALDLMTAFAGSGYLIQFIGLTEILVGVLLLFNLPALAMVILSPIMLNIIAFHVFLFPNISLAIVAVLLVIQIYIMAKNWSAYNALFMKTH